MERWSNDAPALVHRAFRKTHPEVTARVSAMIRATPSGLRGLLPRDSEDQLTPALEEVKCPSLGRSGSRTQAPVAMAPDSPALPDPNW